MLLVLQNLTFCSSLFAESIILKVHASSVALLGICFLLIERCRRFVISTLTTLIVQNLAACCKIKRQICSAKSMLCVVCPKQHRMCTIRVGVRWDVIATDVSFLRSLSLTSSVGSSRLRVMVAFLSLVELIMVVLSRPRYFQLKEIEAMQCSIQKKAESQRLIRRA
jgi:hypothetical protein